MIKAIHTVSYCFLIPATQSSIALMGRKECICGQFNSVLAGLIIVYLFVLVGVKIQCGTVYALNL